MEVAEEFRRLVTEGKKENTYKCAWAKALLDYSIGKEQQQPSLSDPDLISVPLAYISEKFLSYYWNQEFFFGINQCRNKLKQPEFIQYVRSLIDDYKQRSNSSQPRDFLRVSSELKKHGLLDKAISKGVRTLKQDVAHRFLNHGSSKSSLYRLNKANNELLISKSKLEELARHASLLSDAVTLAWVRFCEKHDSSPRLANKIRAVADTEGKGLRRTINLKTTFGSYLNLDNPEHTCFLCNNPISGQELSIDHVLPWSYLFQDDLWNLVYAHKSCNSAKSNVIPDQDSIKRLNNRNEHLMKLMLYQHPNKAITADLQLAVNDAWIDKYYNSLK